MVGWMSIENVVSPLRHGFRVGALAIMAFFASACATDAPEAADASAIPAASRQAKPKRADSSARPNPTVIAPMAGVGPANLGVVVNNSDPLSVEIGRYYLKKRDIPAANLIEVDFAPGQAVMSKDVFQSVKAQVDRRASPKIQALALTWRMPYAVDCMSITTAFTFGFDPQFCASGCQPTKVSPYFNSNSTAPFTDLGIRPTMAIAAVSFDKAKELIDRGVAADGSYPRGTAYLLETTDKARSVRISAAGRAPLTELSPRLQVAFIKANEIRFKDDVMFYFTGLPDVPHLENNHYLPGAMADHLTSSGGVLSDDNSQMSALKWLYYGATGSYGAVVEPCNFVTKFPSPGLAIARYASGETLLEAYWKSVNMPGQGIFIGEPLARPYGGFKVEVGKDGAISIYSHRLTEGTYNVLAADQPLGPYRPVADHLTVGKREFEVRFKHTPTAPYYALQKVSGS